MALAYFGSSRSGESSDIVYEGKDLEALSTMRRYREWMVAHFLPYLGGGAVEIGAGIGSMSEQIYPHVSTLDLVEPSPNLIVPLTTRFGHQKMISITNETFEGFVATKPDKSFDCIIMVNVLEHIKDDRLALKECYRILRPGGYLLILVPSLQFLFSKLDDLVGHYRRYERRELGEKIRDSHFHLEDMRYFDLIGIMPWWLINTVGGATEFNPLLMNLYDTLVVPVSRTVEAVCKPPIGKNLIAISRRP